MANGIRNATALDGATDWTGTASGAVVIATDEALVGGPGRGVITATAATGAGQTHSLVSSQLLFAAGETIEAFAHHAAILDDGDLVSQLNVMWFEADGDFIGREAVSTPKFANRPRRGLPASFGFSRARLTPPAGAFRAKLELRATTPGGGGASLKLALLKPFLGATIGDRPACWTPGPHTNPDLNLASWPESLPDPREIDSPRTPTRVAFSTDSGIPVGRRIGTRGRIRFSAELALTLEQRDTLDQFIESRNLLAESAPFWFVHPDTRQLTRAWIDPEEGDPADTGSGRSRRTRFGLLLEVA